MNETNSQKNIASDDDHFIRDGMNGFERNVKRFIDCITALVAMIVFWTGYLQARAYRAFRSSVLHL